LKNPFIEPVRALLGSPGYRPLNKSELVRELGVPSKERATFREALAQLEQGGEIELLRKSRYALARPDGGGGTSGRFSGRIEFSPDRKRRSAYFYPDEPGGHAAFGEDRRPRVYVPGHFTATALHGDRVEVELSSRPAPKWHRYAKRGRRNDRPAAHGIDEGASWQAKVARIVERDQRPLVGVFHARGSRAALAPEDGRLPPQFQLMEVLPEARSGDIVVAEFLDWTDTHLMPMARMTRVLGRDEDPGIAMLKIIHRYGLPLEFPEPVLAEAGAIPLEIDPAEADRREDWREREVFTIDPEDARDFDDAICVTPRPEGGWELAVHIADVSHYVRAGSALDREARRRGNSVYLADRVIPMLPEKLSNGVCSLKPDEDRLTQAAILQFDASGKRAGARFASAVIRSHRRYTYEEAYERMFLSDKAIADLDEDEASLARHLRRAWELASLLRRRRFGEGALDLDFPEVRVVLDEAGRAVGVKKSLYDESHQLIEEFMLAANEAVACETKNAPAPSVYRVHEDPDPERLQEFAELARSFGHRVGDVTHRPELQKLLAAIRGRHEEHSLKIALLKSLKRAAYSEESLGHYGLSKANYTHYTSPIRRYADLAVHRVLLKILSKRGAATAPKSPDTTPSLEEIGEFAGHISRTERIAAEAEMESQRLKMIEYLEHLHREEPERTFEATVFEVRPIGAFIELDELLLKGMVRKVDLPSRDGYFFDRTRRRFASSGRAAPIAPGSVLRVRLCHVDREKGFLDFELA